MLNVSFPLHWIQKNGGDFFSLLDTTLQNSSLPNWINASVVQPATNFWENPSAFVSNTTSDASSFLSNWVNTSVIQPATNFWESRSVCILNNEIHLDDPSTVSKILFGLGTILVPTGLALACIGCCYKKIINRNPLPNKINPALATCSPNAIRIMKANAPHAARLLIATNNLYANPNRDRNTQDLQNNFLRQTDEGTLNLFSLLKSKLRGSNLAFNIFAFGKAHNDRVWKRSYVRQQVEIASHYYYQGGDNSKITDAGKAIPYSECYTAHFGDLCLFSLLKGMSLCSSPTYFLPGVASAIFSYAAYNDIPLFKWPTILLDSVKIGGPLYNASVKKFLEQDERKGDKNTKKIFDMEWEHFISRFQEYISLRLQLDGKVNVSVTADTPEGRDVFNNQWITSPPQISWIGKNPQLVFSGPPVDSGLSNLIIGFDAMALTFQSLFPDANLQELKPSELKSKAESLIEELGGAETPSVRLPYVELAKRTIGQMSHSIEASAMASYYFGAILGESALPSRFTPNIEDYGTVVLTPYSKAL